MAHVLSQLRLVTAEVNDEGVNLAKELGLEVQAQRLQKPLAENIFTALSEDEITLWHHHCPTRYIEGANVQPLEQYGFDTIPLEVMRHWKKIKDNYSFDRYEIWTTERTVNTDPLLIGVIGQKLYLLARWGLESPEQLSLREIAENIYKQTKDEAIKDSEHLDFISYIFGDTKQKRLERLLLEIRRYHSEFRAAERFLGLN